ncbi:MAG: AIR synthase-related protein [Lacrimispora sp.]|uniref:AIR synthase-related protein n=1 Tax=Lacrimispora sp. TaxID=2719234 RepID=UPI0039E5F507
MRRIERENTGTMKPGQDIVIAGYAGLWATVEIIKHKKEDLRQWFSEDYMDRVLEDGAMALEGNPEKWAQAGASECEAAGEGGVLKALWDLSGAYMTGISFSLRKIPVKQETIEICERYDLNPYRLFSTGCLVLLADNGGDLVLALEKEGVTAAVIGKVTDGIKRVIIHEESNGYLERPSRDEIYKVLAE